MKEIIEKIHELNIRRYLYLTMSVSMSILILILTLRLVSVESRYNTHLLQYKALEVNILKILSLRLPDRLQPSSYLYRGYKTPPIILSEVHNSECSRKTTCKVGTSGEIGPFQIMKHYREDKRYCKNLDVSNFFDAIECADRVLYANYLTHNQDWRWTLEFYNGGSSGSIESKGYANNIINNL